MRLFGEKKKRNPADNLATHLSEVIENEYLASTTQKLCAWISEVGIKRARVYLQYLAQQNEKKITNAELACEIVTQLCSYQDGSLLENSKNLRALIAKETCEYMGLSMKAYRIKVSEVVMNCATTRGLRQDPRLIEAEVAVTMLKALLNPAPTVQISPAVR